MHAASLRLVFDVSIRSITEGVSMKASELVGRLEYLIKTDGDLNVFYHEDDHGHMPIHSATIEEKRAFDINIMETVTGKIINLGQ